MPESVDLPGRQARLREACCLGDVREVQRLLSMRVEGWRGWCLRLVGLGKQEPATLDFIYATDISRRHLMHYIMSGIAESDPQLSRLCASEDVTCRSTNSPQRAKLLSWVLSRALLDASFDWNVSDSGGRTLVYWAVLSHSVEVLNVLCAHVEKIGGELNVSQPDHSGTTPLDIAVASQQWRCVKALLDSGGLEGSVRLRNAVDRLPVLPGESRPRSQAGSTSVVSVVNAFLGYWSPHSLLDKSASAASLAGMSDEDDASAPACVAPLVFSSMQEVEGFWDQQTMYVSSVCAVDVSVARNLLKEHAHDTDAAIQGFLVSKGSGVAHGGESESAPATLLTCCVCYLSFSPTAVNVQLPCGHNRTCPSCWRGYILSKLDDGQAAHLQCTQPGCRMAVPLAEAKRVLPAASHPRLHTQVLNSYVDSNPHIKWCPRPGCTCSISLMQQVKDNKVTVEALTQRAALTVRCTCGHAFCWHCLEDAHEPASCAQVKDWRKLLSAEQHEQDKDSEVWMTSHTQPCPNCSAKVQRSGGCNHMICTVCMQHFCYVCGREWSLHGPESGGFYVCTLPSETASSTSALCGLTRRVSVAVKNVVRLIYTRQADYIRRYAAQNGDTRDLSRLLSHILRIYSDALPGEIADQPAGVEDVEGGAPDAATGGTAREADGAEDKWADARSDHAASDDGASTSGLSRRPSATLSDAACCCSNAAPAAPHSRGSSPRSGSLPLLPLAANPLAANSTESVRTPRTGGLGILAGAAAGRQRLSAHSPMASILAEWEHAVAVGRTLARNTCIATYYMERCPERDYLEAQQKRLEQQIGQLTTVLHALPHRSTVLAALRAEEGGPRGGAPEPWFALLRGVLSAVGDIGSGLASGVVSVVEALICPQRSVLKEISVQGQQMRDQFYYVVALQQQRSRIVHLLQRVQHTSRAIIRTGRVKHT